MPAPRHVVLRLLPLALWCGAVWYLSAQTDPEEAVGIALAIPDWAAHGIEYLVGGLLARHAFARTGTARSTAFALVFCLLWALLDEWHQSFVPGREPDVLDVVADVVGASLGALVHAVASRRLAR